MRASSPGSSSPASSAGHAPPFGWYWSASRSRASAPSPSAICVTSPVAPGWLVESSPRSLGLAVAAAAGREHDGPRLEVVLAAHGAPAAVGPLEVEQRGLRERPPSSPPSTASRSALVIAWPVRSPTWSSRLRRRAAAACQAVAAVLARELDPELLEPVDRRRRLRGEHLDELAVGRLVRRAPHVFRVELGRVVVAERRLDAALRLRRVARLERALGRERDARAGALGRDGGREPRGAAPDHEHVEVGRLRHGFRCYQAYRIGGISQAYSIAIARLMDRIASPRRRRGPASAGPRCGWVSVGVTRRRAPPEPREPREPSRPRSRSGAATRATAAGTSSSRRAASSWPAAARRGRSSRRAGSRRRARTPICFSMIMLERPEDREDDDHDDRGAGDGAAVRLIP